MPSVNQFHEGFHAGAVDDFDTDFDAGLDGNAPEHDGVRRVRKKRHKGRRIALIVFAVLFTLIVGSGIALAAYVSSLNTSMGFDDKQEEAELKEALQPASASESATRLLIVSRVAARSASCCARTFTAARISSLALANRPCSTLSAM